MSNILLLIFDFTIFLPITLIRLILIYFFGSKYDIEYIKFLDVMMHSNQKYFNQQEDPITIDTMDDDIRISVNYSSRFNKDQIQIVENNEENKLDENETRKVLEDLLVKIKDE